MLAWLARHATHKAAVFHSRFIGWFAAYLTDVIRWSRGAEWHELRRDRRRLFTGKAERDQKQRQSKPRQFAILDYGEGA